MITIKLNRKFSMPSKSTFQCHGIRAFVDSYLAKSKISIDPFARNFQGCKYTNDINPKTKAKYHMYALEFLDILRQKDIKSDLVIFDPPYSLEQCKRSYDNFSYDDTLNCIYWTEEKNIILDLLELDGIFLHFGWHSNGMGKKRGFAIEEILLVSHGGAHNDTICMAERRTSEQIKII